MRHNKAMRERELAAAQAELSAMKLNFKDGKRVQYTTSASRQNAQQE